MKNLGILITAMLIVFFISSCAKKPSELIVGEWKIADIKTSEEIAPDIKEERDKAIEDMKASSLFVIKADSTFENTISESTENGKWSLSDDGKKLTLTYESGKSEVSNVEELTETKLTTSIDFNGTKNTIFYEKEVK